MPWQEVSTMSAREEFVVLASGGTIGFRALCRRFGVSPKTGYKWLDRYRRDGVAALADRSRRPHCSPRRTAADAEQRILRLRDAHPAWGGRKLRARLLAMESGGVSGAGAIATDPHDVCSASAIVTDPHGTAGAGAIAAELHDIRSAGAIAAELHDIRSAGPIATDPRGVLTDDPCGAPAGGPRGVPGAGAPASGPRGVPSASTITAVLRRHGRLDPAAAAQHTAWKRFEYEAPNALWQMDFKGDFALPQGRCYPLTVLDDHSRFSLGLRACGNQRGATVQGHLTELFRRYGLPERILTDNGPPWAAQGQSDYTTLSAWLIRLGVRPMTSAAYHPQTLGKDERFHRTLKAEVLGRDTWRDLTHCQTAFDRWRDVYNLERPHEALGLQAPAARYRPSPRPFPAELPPIAYGPDDQVRRVRDNGVFSFRGRLWRAGAAFARQPVALRPTREDGVFDVFYCRERIAVVSVRVNSDPASRRGIEGPA